MVDLQFSSVFDIAELPEPVHEEADTRACRTDHLGERFLTDLDGDRLALRLVAGLPQQEKDAGQTLFAGIEQMVDEVHSPKK